MESDEPNYQIKSETKSLIPYRCWANCYDGGCVQLYDTRDYFKTLQGCTYPASKLKTIELTKNYMTQAHHIAIMPEMIENFDQSKMSSMLLFKLLNEKCGLNSDWIYGIIEKTPHEKDNWETKPLTLTIFDFFFNIKVFGGTYAKLCCEGSRISRRCEFDMTPCVRLNPDGTKKSTTFTFHDVDRTNPLWAAFTYSGSELNIYTDGSKIEYSAGLLTVTKLKHIMYLNSHTVNEIQNHILLISRVPWYPSYTFPCNELIDISESE